MSTIAALFVQRDGCYAGLEGVEHWTAPRVEEQGAFAWLAEDARRYAGPYPVVAHPPCSRWCRLAGLVEARWGHRRGDDGGCFASALASVRRWGGVLEHPAYTDAWRAFDLPRPNRAGGWLAVGEREYVAHVEQGRYGHSAKKATWLFVAGVDAERLPAMRWGSEADQRSRALVSWCGNRVASGERRPRLSNRAASATPSEFRDALIAIARSVTR